MHGILPKNERQLKLWRSFHPQAIYGPEEEELLVRANRRKLVRAYYGIDKEFAKEMDKLVKKLVDKKSDTGKLIEKIDILIDKAEGRLLATTVKESQERTKARQKELLKLHEAFHA